jgi:ribonuclease HI
LAEAYALWCGLFIAKEVGIRTLSIFGDSMIVIKAMIGKSYPEGSKLKNIISRIKQEINSFVRVLFPYKKDLNEEADQWAK